MKRTLLTSLFALSTCAAIAGAQTPPTTTSQSPATSTSQAPATTTPATTTQSPASAASQTVQRAAAANSLTLEGCVQRNTSASSTAGATGTAGTANFFILEKAAKPSSAATTASSASPVALVSTYRLEADDAKLMPHVGHKVEVTGTVETAMGTSTAAAGSASSMNAANAPKFKVDAVKMIAASCTP